MSFVARPPNQHRQEKEKTAGRDAAGKSLFSLQISSLVSSKFHNAENYFSKNRTKISVKPTKILTTNRIHRSGVNEIALGFSNTPDESRTRTTNDG